MIERYALLVGAGLLGGAMNAVAGGGSLVTFPALVFAGLPPVIANTTSTVAVLPGTLASAWAYRNDGLRGVGGLSLRVMVPVTVVGGLVGALLLLFAPGSTFEAVIPWLLLFATFVYAGGRELGLALSRRVHIGKTPVLVAQFLISIYGGYFGGAVGLLMMAVWCLFDPADIKSFAPVRTVLISAANTMAVVCFILAGAVRWPEMFAMLVAAVAGGYLGAHWSRHIPPMAIRIFVVVLCAVVTVVFFLRGR